MSRAYVALGGNLGGPAARIRAVFAELDRLPRCRLVRASSLYRTAPVGYADQPDFVNAVALLDTGLAPDALMRALLALEARHGRVRSLRNGPRTLDLDLLMYDQRRSDLDFLTLPHPRMHLRAFVLAPLVEIDPGCVIPGRGRADRLLAALDDTDTVSRLGTPDLGFDLLCRLGAGLVPGRAGDRDGSAAAAPA